MGRKYVINNHALPHFITFSVVQWVDVLTKSEYKDVILKSLVYCQENKGLNIHAYVLMSNHVHFILSARKGANLSDILRDFKKFTSKKIIQAISDNPQESRRNWLLWIFKANGERNANNKRFQFWQQGNHPIQLDSNHLIDQRLEYLHFNPVKAGIVDNAEEYKYSSASNYFGGKGMIEVERID